MNNAVIYKYRQRKRDREYRTKVNSFLFFNFEFYVNRKLKHNHRCITNMSSIH